MKRYNNIIIISVDNLRADCINSNPINYYEQKHKIDIEIGNNLLNKIVKESVFFNNCISAAPYTSASHGAIFSGFWPIKNDVYSFFNKTIKKKLIFEWAKDEGYSTVFQTDFPIILGDYLELNRGSDHFFIEDELSAFDKIKKLDKSVSFFHFAGCHYPYGFHKLKFGGQDYINKVKFLENRHRIDQKQSEDALTEAFRTGDDLKYLLRYKNIIETLYSRKEYDMLFNLYLEGINYFFKNRFNSFLEGVVAYIKKNKGLLVIVADHGEEWDDFSYGHYNSVDRGVLTLPIIFYDPANKKNSKIINERISSVDVGATLIELITGQKNLNLNGSSQIDSIWSNAKVNSHDSFSQIWRTKETFAELLSFQKQAISSGKIPLEAKAPYLEQEVVYWDNYRLHCIYNENDSPTKKKLENSGSEIKDKNLESIGSKKLKEYNSGLDIKKGSSVVTNFSIRAQLNAMGYNV